MVGGQLLDIQSEGPVTREDLIHLQKLKTGSFIQFCLMSPATLIPCDPSESQTLQAFAQSLSMAFQISDDLLDLHWIKKREEMSVDIRRI